MDTFYLEAGRETGLFKCVFTFCNETPDGFRPPLDKDF